MDSDSEDSKVFFSDDSERVVANEEQEEDKLDRDILFNRDGQDSSHSSQ